MIRITGIRISGIWAILCFFIFQSCGGQSRLVSDQELTVVEQNLEYYLYLPPGYSEESSETFGLLLFLHGGGEAGQDLEQLKKQGPPKRLLEGPDLPFLVLAPQHPEPKMWWNTRAVMQLLDHVVSSHRVDPDRIYLTGLSRGASACWEMAVHYPDTFAAMAVVCGMTPLPYAHWIDPKLPIWAFHGTDDPVIPFSESREMIDALKELGNDARLTVYDGVGHNAWDRAYADEALYLWLDAQSRSKAVGKE